MKAIMKQTAAPGAELVDVDVPSPGPKDLLIKVKVAAICGTDIHIYDWTKFAQDRITPPMIFGHEVCGEVVEVGAQVDSHKKGDLVAVETHIPCGQCYQCQLGNQHVCEQMAIVGVHTNTLSGSSGSRKRISISRRSSPLTWPECSSAMHRVK